MTMASRLAVMSHGKLLQVGAPAQIYEAPANRFVADFIGNVNLLDGKVVEAAGDHVVVACADMRHRIEPGATLAPGSAVSIALRPEKIRIAPDAPGDSGPGPNRVRGTVRDIAYFGSFTVYHLALPSGGVLKVSQGNVERSTAGHLAAGDAAWASWSATAPVVLTS